MPQAPALHPALNLPPVIGHRGAAGSAPENTLAGFRRAAVLGLTWVECDLRLSADEEVVLLHDASLERTTSGTGLLAACRLSDLVGLDAGSWFGGAFAQERVPTLRQALDCWRECGLGANLELKTEDGSAAALVRALAHLLRKPQLLPPLLVSSFEPEALAAAQMHLPGLARGYLVEELTEDRCAHARRWGCASVHADAARLSQDAVLAARAQALEVLAYTVNDPARARELWGWGVRSIFTDFPERMSAPDARIPPPASAPPR